MLRCCEDQMSRCEDEGRAVSHKVPFICIQYAALSQTESHKLVDVSRILLPNNTHLLGLLV